MSAGFTPSGAAQNDTDDSKGSVNAPKPSPGDWNSVILDQYSNDTNIEVINEYEQGFVPQAGAKSGDTNNTPATAQPLGAGTERIGR